VAPRIVLFGATGYTGRLTAEAMAAAGARPVLAGFEELGPLAAGRCGLVPAFGYDFVPGNLAGALALAESPRRPGSPSGTS
jgi:uncharacterized protein YbjT (DUF2867 family)